MYYTGKGDGGTTTLFGSRDRVSKQDPIFNALGSLDELNCWLGVCATKAATDDDEKIAKEISPLLIRLQEQLFIIQAELAGSDKKMELQHSEELESTIAMIAPQLKERTSFTVPGGSELSASLDYGRALARRCERAVLATEPSENVKKYLNRLSSVLFVLARRVNDCKNIEEQAPSYQ
jgi:cob(I)alamin adenosyltransferase